jgi:hypothetical protein
MILAGFVEVGEVCHRALDLTLNTMRSFLILTCVVLVFVPLVSQGAANTGKPQAAAPTVAPKPGPKVEAETPTPLSAVLKDGTEMRITCGFKGLGWLAPSSGLYHYRLWIPEGYSADPKKAWKAIFIASSVGNAKLDAMGDWVKSHGYIAVMLEESRNGPSGPIVANFLAAHEDVTKRMRIAEGKKVATGFSGGARASSHFVTIVPGFGGLILQGAGCNKINPGGTYDVKAIKCKAVVAVFGKKDMNYKEIAGLKKSFGSRLKVYEFEGGHEWAPKEVIQQALDLVDASLSK